MHEKKYLTDWLDGEIRDIPAEARFQRTLPVKLTEDEVLDRAATLATNISEQVSLEVDAKKTASSFKDAISGKSSEIRRLGGIVAAREEPRTVNCAKVRDERRSSILTVRLDTFEVIESRAMTEDERQKPLFPSVTFTPETREKIRGKKKSADEQGENASETAEAP